MLSNDDIIDLEKPGQIFLPTFVVDDFSVLFYVHQSFLLKKLRKCFLCITCAWSLFCLLRIYVNLHLHLHILLKCYFFFCVLCFLSDLLWTRSHPYKNCYIDFKCSVIFFSIKVIMKT